MLKERIGKFSLYSKDQVTDKKVKNKTKTSGEAKKNREMREHYVIKENENMLFFRMLRRERRQERRGRNQDI